MEGFISVHNTNFINTTPIKIKTGSNGAVKDDKRHDHFLTSYGEALMHTT
jgi:hypothetical protein